MPSWLFQSTLGTGRTIKENEMNTVTCNYKTPINATLDDGDIIHILGDGYYIVARMTDNEDYQLRRYLIALSDGNRWSDTGEANTDTGEANIRKLHATIDSDWYKLPAGAKITIQV